MVFYLKNHFRGASVRQKNSCESPHWLEFFHSDTGVPVFHGFWKNRTHPFAVGCGAGRLARVLTDVLAHQPGPLPIFIWPKFTGPFESEAFKTLHSRLIILMHMEM
jgi:hypothetical protein